LVCSNPWRDLAGRCVCPLSLDGITQSACQEIYSLDIREATSKGRINSWLPMKL
jgi:hypothetical protein